MGLALRIPVLGSRIWMILLFYSQKRLIYRDGMEMHFMILFWQRTFG